jgi:FAD:protein FMN transferase
MNLVTHEHEFRAMGSVIELSLIGGTAERFEASVRQAEHLAAEWERTFSRFDPDSELSRFNATGDWDHLSERLRQGIEIALHGRDITGGLFDPTILSALIAAGYDRSFETIGVASAADEYGHDDTSTVRSIAGGREGHARQRNGFDLGGVAKGMYADVLAEELADWPGGLISAGGDLRVWGDAPDGDTWTIGIEHPDHPEQDVLDLVIHDGAVATSGLNRRAWMRGGQRLHHLIDPRTGLPADARLATITVVSGLATQAEIVATALFVGFGSEPLEERLRPWFTLAVGVDHDAQIHVIDGHQEPNHAAA